MICDSRTLFIITELGMLKLQDWTLMDGICLL